MRRPSKLLHADWSIEPARRWVAEARLTDDGYRLSAPRRVRNQIDDAVAAGEDVLIGFDFPIGLPSNYARKVGATSFLELLPRLGKGEWAEFFEPARQLDQVSLRRPFYPRGTARAGDQEKFLRQLGFSSMDELRRDCGRRQSSRRAAAVVFWTVGANQVGKAAITGWRDVLQPALRAIHIWPFHGRLHDLKGPTVCETYPAAFYGAFGLPPEKNNVEVRSAAASALLAAARRVDAEIDESLKEQIEDGFSSGDAYDAFVGLLGMISVLAGERKDAPELSAEAASIEGWMFGQTAPMAPLPS